jgi:hypothetical protein
MRQEVGSLIFSVRERKLCRDRDCYDDSECGRRWVACEREGIA